MSTQYNILYHTTKTIVFKKKFVFFIQNGSSYHYEKFFYQTNYYCSKMYNCLFLLLMIRPVTGHVTASEPHDIADARSSTPPKKDSEHKLIRC